jgi:periplasmic protein TonB
MVPLKTAKADLIGKYKRHLKISFILSILLLILAFKFSPMPGKIEPIKEKGDGPIVISNTDPTYQKPKVPEPPKAPEIIVANVDDDIEDLILTDVGIDANSNLGKPNPLLDKPELPEEPPTFRWSEVMPEPIGGLAAIQEKVNYTEIAKRIGIEGRVIIEATIDKTGDVIDAEIIRGLGFGLDEEALQAVQNTKFFPGIQRGKPVRVRISIPIKFVLK